MLCTYLQLHCTAAVLSMEKTSACLKKSLCISSSEISATFHLTYGLWKATVVKNKLLDTYRIEGLYDISLSMEPGLIYFAPKQKKLKNKNNIFPFFAFPVIFRHPSKGKAHHEVTVVLHSITGGRIKSSCLGGWFIAAQVELNVSFPNLYLIRRGFWLFCLAEETRELHGTVGSSCALTLDLV